ncbi:XRE family transcriptional regulator [Burkholderia reimsis]|uniref:XRE family transcriptional regulator n=2 Tax=Burkholderia reimsis TaxID=2234132 RepID=A0A365QWX3_9BURK|nr:XRE family transcriptional regulator [Burkholderia reimsis]
MQPSAADLRVVREFLALVETSVTTPDSDTLRALREQLGITQAQAAELMRVNLRTWQKWELGERTMHVALFELFLIKTGV